MNNETIEAIPADSHSRIANEGKARGSIVAMSLACVILFVSFFLPWLKILGATATGFELAKHSSGVEQALWLIPICSFLLLLGAASGQTPRIGTLFTGALPCLALWTLFHSNGKQLLQFTDIGLYLSVASGIFLALSPYLGAKRLPER